MNRFWAARGDFLLVLFLGALFFALSSPHLSQPGLYYDEAYEAAVTVKFLTSTPSPISLSTLSLFGLQIPWSSSGFEGLLKSYLLLPVFALFGSSVLVLRATMLCVGAVNLLLTFYLARLVMGRFSAFLTLLLLVSDPNFVFETRMDWGPSVLAYFFRVAGCIFLIRGWQKKRKGEWILALLSFLLGIYTKITFHIFLIPFGITLLLFFRKDLVGQLRNRIVRNAVWLFCILSLMITVHFLRELPYTSFPSRPLAAKILFLFQFLKGKLSLKEILGSESVKEMGDAWYWLLFLVTFFLVWTYPFSKKVQEELRQKRGFTTTLCALMLILLLTLKGVRHGCHFFILYPFPHLVIGFTVQALLKENALKLSLYLIFLLVIAGSGLRLIQTAPKLFVQTGGAGDWSDAIYGLGDYLLKQESKEVFCLDWGFHRNLMVITQGKVTLSEPFWPWRLEGRDARDDLRALLSQPNHLYLLHEKGHGRKINGSHVKEWAEEVGYPLERLRTFHQRNGEALFSVYRVSPAALSHH